MERLPAILPEGEQTPPPEAADVVEPLENIDEDDISTILFPDLLPLAVPLVISTSNSTEPRCALLQVLSDEARLSSTRPGRPGGPIYISRSCQAPRHTVTA